MPISPKTLTIATRGSKLALWQAGHIKALIEQRHAGTVRAELLIIKTTGDIIQDVPLAKVGGKGLFVKEIEEALLDGRADIAVHSMKDVPMQLPENLCLGIVPEREDPRDCLLSALYAGLSSLPAGATVGTSSLRRQAQLLRLRPDLNITSLRGNVDTRLNKLMKGDFDAIVMASAGMKRLGLSAPFMEPLSPLEFLPACGQGALGIEFKEDRQDLFQFLDFLEHKPTRICVEAERSFLTGLNGGCQVPIAGHAVLTASNTVLLEGLVADVQGKNCLTGRIEQDVNNARECGLALAQDIITRGGQEILAEVY
jgi:hydroxymethylbilane synthase